MNPTKIESMEQNPDGGVNIIVRAADTGRQYIVHLSEDSLVQAGLPSIDMVELPDGEVHPVVAGDSQATETESETVPAAELQGDDQEESPTDEHPSIQICAVCGGQGVDMEGDSCQACGGTGTLQGADK